MQVGVVHLLGEMMITQDLIKLGEQARLAVRGGLVEALFVVDDELRGVVRRYKVKLAIFVDSFGRAKPERFVFDDRPARGQVIIPAQEVGHALPGNIGTVEYIVPVVDRRDAVRIISPRFCKDVDYASR